MTGAERVFDAITQVRDDYVDAAGDHRFARRRWTAPPTWRQYAALAACLVLIVGGAFALSQVRMGSMDNGGDGWTGGSANAGSGWNGNAAPPPEGDEPGDTAPPPTGPDEGDPPSGEGSGCELALYWDCTDGAVPTLVLEAEGVTVTREVTLMFYESAPTWVKDRYILTAGESGGMVTAHYEGAAFLNWSGDAAELEDGTFALPAGGMAEAVIRTEAAAAGSVLSLAEPEGVTPEDTTVIVASRRWMEKRGITVMLGDTVLDP